MLHWSLVRLAHCLLVIALNDVYYFEQINMMMMMMMIISAFALSTVYNLTSSANSTHVTSSLITLTILLIYNRNKIGPIQLP